MESIRIGKISAINYEAGTVRVVYHEKDDAVTREIPLLSFEYKMPHVDDLVLVLHLSNGAEAGVVMGRPWSRVNVPPESGAGLWRKDVGDTYGEAFLRYKNGVLTIKANQIVLDAPVNATSTVTAAGDVTGGGISLMGHTHTDSMGGSTTPPN